MEYRILSQPWLLGAAAVVTWSLALIMKALLHPLRDIPGPFWARFTRLWYLRAVRKGDFEMKNIDLHRSYGKPSFAWVLAGINAFLGSIIRIAPGQYSLSDPQAIRTIYSHSSSFIKVSFPQEVELEIQSL